MIKDAIYWMALEYELDFRERQILLKDIEKFLNNNEKLSSIECFFETNKEEKTKCESIIIDKIESSVAGYALLAETLQNEGIEIIPIISLDYPNALKDHLGKSAPMLLYIKGNKQLLQKESVAIVGSRNASDFALEFTKNIVEFKSKEDKAIVSGFAKGVDRRAFDSAMEYEGKSILVLPHGIISDNTKYIFKTIYEHYIKQHILILSTFHPRVPWDKKRAMARNSTIYGLSKEVYVAESKPSKNREGKDTKGGTYAGVINGLKTMKGKIKIYVRKPHSIEKEYAENFKEFKDEGAIPVDINGKQIDTKSKATSRQRNEKNSTQLRMFDAY